MEKLLISDAADKLGISKEAVYNRIRRKSLQSITENGIKYVIIDESQPVKSTLPSKFNEERYINHLLDQINELKNKVDKLENEKDKLINDKEELLISSKKELEAIYNHKDMQLKNMLELIAKPLIELANRTSESFDAEFEELPSYEKDLILSQQKIEWINLQDLMRQKGYSYKKQKKINQIILSKVGINENVKEENGHLFIKNGVKIKQIIKDEA